MDDEQELTRTMATRNIIELLAACEAWERAPGTDQFIHLIEEAKPLLPRPVDWANCLGVSGETVRLWTNGLADPDPLVQEGMVKALKRFAQRKGAVPDAVGKSTLKWTKDTLRTGWQGVGSIWPFNRS